MAVSISNLRLKIRQLIDDNSSTTSDIFTYSTSNIFTLSEANVIALSNVYINNNERGTSESSFDSTTNRVTLSLTMSSGDTVQIEYTYYPNYSDTELLNYIRATLTHLSLNNYNTFEYDSTDNTIYPEITLEEENLIAIIASILIRPDNKSYRLPDITINVAKDYPTNEKISRAIASAKKNSTGIIDIL